MAVDHWWLGTTSADHAVAANWSTAGSGGAPGASVPGTGNEVLFDGNGNNPCTLSANWTIQNLTTVAGFTAKLDLATFNTPFDDGGNVTLDGGGEFDMGSGSMTVTNGTFDNEDQATFTKGTSTLVMAGAGTITTDNTGDVFNVTIQAGAVIGVTDQSSSFDLTGTLNVLGTLNLNQLTRAISSNVTIQTGGTIAAAGNGTLEFNSPSAGEGLITFDGTLSAPVLARVNVAAAVFRPGNYSGGFKIIPPSAGGLEFDAAGDYVFGSFEIESALAVDWTLDNSANGPKSITVVGATTIDLNGAGNIIIDDSGQDVAWILQGSKTLEDAGGGGKFQWIHDLTQFPRREYLPHGGLMTGGRL